MILKNKYVDLRINANFFFKTSLAHFSSHAHTFQHPKDDESGVKERRCIWSQIWFEF